LGQTDNQSSEKGVFQWDENIRKWVRKYDKPGVDGKIPMPLDEYLKRKHHAVKGSWHRQPDKRHAYKEALEHDDFGRAGCGNSHGLWHPKRDGRCIYCGLNQGQLDKIHKKDDEAKA